MRVAPGARAVWASSVELCRKARLFETGSHLYCEAWAHMKAGRPKEAASIGERYLKKYKKGTARDKTRLMLAECYLALPDPDTAAHLIVQTCEALTHRYGNGD